MDFDTFKESLKENQAPAGLQGPLLALWKAGRGDWQGAHEVVQDDEGKQAAWVHAYLHRDEGDAANAAYWYRRAGRPVCGLSLDAEWEEIVQEVLNP